MPQSATHSNSLFNTFQAVVATDNNTNATFVLFLYEDMQWIATASEVGFNSESISGFYNLENTNANMDTLSNIRRPGMFVFRVDQEKIQLPISKYFFTITNK